jgi:hypothetical protein
MPVIVTALIALAGEIINQFGPVAVQALASLLQGQKVQPVTTEQALALESLAADAAAQAIAAAKK